ncbi:MAG: GTPase HflX [Gammaproteobacteria bacterium RIFCSPHIGHO2_12_FULL_40_19]|nr:MAG: GTPase HflX [Gammaproteobacteria bacterium RIFCSPHIGHO2_12_FULL_40_19]
MTKEFFIQREKGGERVVLVQMAVYQAEHFNHFEDALAEFESLAISAAAKIVDVIVGKLPTVHPKYFVGEGKAHAIAEAVKTHSADLVLFNHALSPAQARNCEELFGCRVHDRAELILDIFSQRARTFEGKLQVELAQLEHISTRLVRGWTHLERQKGGIGLRGPGETQLETDRRLVAGRIKSIKKRLEKVEKQREQSRRARERSEMPVISIVGYTNAGKSTLFNRLTEATVYVADRLFATLDTTCRNIVLPKIGPVVLADTVGFIQQLPHELIAAFKATLEETRQADLLLHVVDSYSDNSAQMMGDVNEILAEIGAQDILQLQVMNKIDLSQNFHPRIDYDAKNNPKRVWISSEKNIGIDLLKQAITELLTKRIVRCRVSLQPHQGKLRAKLYALGVVVAETSDDEARWLLDLEIQQLDFERLFKV